jgi:hypothetical protein
LNWTSVNITGSGNSSCHHMPACAGVPVFHPTSVRPRGELSVAWLAVVFHVDWVWMSTGSSESISSTVQLVLRAGVAARTRATSAGVMNDCGVAEAVAHVRSHRRDPVVFLRAHRDHHFGIGSGRCSGR